MNKVLLICQKCMRTKKMNLLQDEPPMTRFILIEQCDKCIEDHSGSVRYFSSEMVELKKD